MWPTLLYAGFDGLDVAFQGRVSNRALELLADARAEAERIDEPVPRELNGLPFLVAPTGARHGYRYRLDTGDDGEVWFVRHGADPAQWNLRVSVKSFALLTYGYAGVKRRLYERLHALEASTAAASVGRVDFACDLAAPGFEPAADCFVAPGPTKARSYSPREGMRAEDDAVVHWLARRVNGVTVGRITGRQICLYDKRRDSLDKRKLYWFDVWNIDRRRRQAVWRVEVRAGKEELKGRWKVGGLEELEGALGDIVASSLANVRYVAPSPRDTNASRWPTHPLWQAARTYMVEAIARYAFAPAAPRRDLLAPRWMMLDERRRQIVGLAAGYGGLAGLTPDQAGDLAGLVAAAIRDYAREHPGAIEDKLRNACARYRIV